MSAPPSVGDISHSGMYAASDFAHIVDRGTPHRHHGPMGDKLDDVIRQKGTAKGREIAEKVFLEFHGLWTPEKVVEAEDNLRQWLARTPPSSPAIADAHRITIDTFAERLRELIAGGQPVGGRG